MEPFRQNAKQALNAMSKSELKMQPVRRSINLVPPEQVNSVCKTSIFTEENKIYDPLTEHETSSDYDHGQDLIALYRKLPASEEELCVALAMRQHASLYLDFNDAEAPNQWFARRATDALI